MKDVSDIYLEKDLEKNKTKNSYEAFDVNARAEELIKKEFTEGSRTKSIYKARDAVERFVGEDKFKETVDKTYLQKHDGFVKRLEEKGIDSKNTVGYCERDGNIYIDRDKGAELTHDLVHENLHFQTEGFKSKSLNEGTTEHFTQQICDRERIPYSKGYYAKETEIAKILDEKLGDDVLKNAYLHGDETAIRGAFGNKLYDGAYEEFNKQMDKGKFYEEKGDREEAQIHFNKAKYMLTYL